MLGNAAPVKRKNSQVGFAVSPEIRESIKRFGHGCEPREPKRKKSGRDNNGYPQSSYTRNERTEQIWRESP